MSKILVAYFSATGTTADAAKRLADAVKGDLFEIRPAVPYTAADLDWTDKHSRSTLEMKDPASRPEVSSHVGNMDQYDTVFVGFPIWWYVAPTIINTFLDEYDFSGKTVIPFATSGGSGMGKTLEEKSLGCIHKGGHSPINAVYDYAKQVESKQGLVIMDTPGNDPSSVAAMVAGGAQVVVFSSGRGTPTGNPIAPVIKLTGNKLTFAKMEDNIDFDASPLIYGTKTLEELGGDLLNMVVETACGKQTKAESLGFTEMAIARVCNYV